MATTETDLYQTDIAFDTDFVVTSSGDLGTVTGLANLKQAIMRRIFTSPGEIIHRPNYGVGLKNYVNSVNSLSAQQDLAARIQDQLLLDSRVESVEGVSVQTDVNDGSMVKISVRVRPVGLAELTLSFSTEGI